MPDISYVGHASADATTVSLPGGTVAGDLAIVTAGRTNASGPSIPAGWTNAGVVSAGSGGTAHGQRAGWKFLSAADITAGNVGTWTNATEIQVLVLRGASDVTSDFGGTGTNGTTLSLPGRTIATGSWIVGMGTHRTQTGTTLTDATVTDYTTRSTGTTSARVWCGTGTASPSTRTITGLASSGNVGYTLEIVPGLDTTRPYIEPRIPAAKTMPGGVGFVQSSPLALLTYVAPAEPPRPSISWQTSRLVTARRQDQPPTWTQNALTLIEVAPAEELPPGRAHFTLPAPVPYPSRLRSHISYFVFDAVEPSEPFKGSAQEVPAARPAPHVGFVASSPPQLLSPPVVEDLPAGHAWFALPPHGPSTWRAPQVVARGAEGTPAPAEAPAGRAWFELPQPKAHDAKLRSHISYFVFDAVEPSEPFKGHTQPLPERAKTRMVAFVSPSPATLLAEPVGTPIFGSAQELPSYQRRERPRDFTHARPSYYEDPVPIFCRVLDLPPRRVPTLPPDFAVAKPQYYVDQLFNPAWAIGSNRTLGLKIEPN